MSIAKRAEDWRLMVFKDAYSMWTERRLTQEQAAGLFGCGREDVPALDGALRPPRDSGAAGIASIEPGGVLSHMEPLGIRLDAPQRVSGTVPPGRGHFATERHRKRKLYFELWA